MYKEIKYWYICLKHWIVLLLNWVLNWHLILLTVSCNCSDSVNSNKDPVCETELHFTEKYQIVSKFFWNPIHPPLVFQPKQFPTQSNPPGLRYGIMSSAIFCVSSILSLGNALPSLRRCSWLPSEREIEWNLISICKL